MRQHFQAALDADRRVDEWHMAVNVAAGIDALSANTRLSIVYAPHPLDAFGQHFFRNHG